MPLGTAGSGPRPSPCSAARAEGEELLRPGSSRPLASLAFADKVVPLRVLYEKYGHCLTQDNVVKVVALLVEYQTQEHIVAMRDIYVKNPDIKIRVRRWQRGRARPRAEGRAQHLPGPESNPGL